MQTPTLVTALLDIGRDQAHPEFRRKFDNYLKSFRRLLALDLPMIIHAESQLHPLILQWRKGRPTRLHVLSSEQLQQMPAYPFIQRIRESASWQSQADWLAKSPQGALPLYNPLVMSKLPWLAQAAKTGGPNDTYIWIDAGIHQHLYADEHHVINETYFRQLIRDPEKLRMFAVPYTTNTEVHGFQREALARYCHTDFVDRCCKGGVFGGGANIIQSMDKHYQALLHETLGEQLMGTEESLLTILSYRYQQHMDVSLLGNGVFPSLFRERPSVLRRLARPRQLVRQVQQRVLRTQRNLNAHQQLQRILTLPPWMPMTQDSAFDLHLLLCARDVTSGLWALRSFLHYSDLNPRIMVHDDGTLTAEHKAELKRQLPSASIIEFHKAENQMATALANHPNCLRYRITEYTWPAIKLLDFAHYSDGRPFLALDADVLFFQIPDEILQAINNGHGCFMSDWQNAYTWPLSRWPAVLQTPGLEKVNVGLIYVPAGLYNLDTVEQHLAAYYRRAPCPNLYWLEQTIWAALFSAQAERMVRLPDTYQISNQRPITSDTRSHHFVNDRHLSRLDLHRKGVPFLLNKNFLKAAGSVA